MTLCGAHKPMSGVADAREKLAIDFNEAWKAWLRAKDFVARAKFSYFA